MTVLRIPVGRPARDSGSAGFSLLEILVAMVIVTVLLGIAVPSYQRYVNRAHRAEAVRLVLGAASCQERLRAQHGYYDTSRCISGLDSERYTFLIEPADEAEALEFRVVAQPRRPSPGDACGDLSLDQAGTRTISGAGSLSDCWGGR